MASKGKLRGKRLAEMFFTRDSPDGPRWTCKCGAKRTQRSSGYSNLCSHITSEHPEYLSLASKDGSVKPPSIEEHFWPRKAIQLHSWLEMIVMGMLPFSFCESDVVRRNMKADSVSVDTFMKYLSTVTGVVERKIARLLPDEFALVFDGWSCGLTYYLSVFATSPYDSEAGWKSVLLSFSPIGDEDSFNADEHITFSDHRFNLAVQEILKGHIDVIEQVHKLMVRLGNLIPSAKLRKLTHLRPKTSNVTRWSSVYTMLRRYVQIREFLPMLHLDIIDEFIPSSRQNREIEGLLGRLADLDSVTLSLQKDSITVVDVRNLFDAVMEEYSETCSRLCQSASVVYDPVFESAICKVLSASGCLSVDEEHKIEHLQCSSSDVDSVNDPDDSLASRALKRRRFAVLDIKSRYIDMRFLVPTSNMCERLFSKAGYALGDRRQSILPANFEAQMFLHMNKGLWGVAEVVEATK